MWTELYNPKMNWIEKKTINVKWQFANIRRLIRVENSIIGGIKRWWHLKQICKKVNKSLLKKAEEMKNKDGLCQ